ncbi:MAG: fatty acid desaturase [Candidatus Eremiobacteraeota bacterium]|nr:fatty acid desaturase [Candidatus Eremiobacteraeota bacterium]
MKPVKPNWVTGTALVLIHIGALFAFYRGFFHWSALVAAVVIMYLTGMLGVTLCYHRTLTHRALRLRKPIEYFTAICGTLAFQGDPINWVATHRIHHAHADREGDPHGIDRGALWAHMDWLYLPNAAKPTLEEEKRFAPDLYASRFYRALKYLHVPLQIALAVVLFLIGGWSWVVWGVFVRLVLSYHTTWLVNSAAHMAGYRSFKTEDQSTNCWWVALLSWGEGWHNNHHAFPFSARHGLRWFEFDITWWLVKLLGFLHLADRIKVPSKAMEQRLAL